jgi:hypothetical protein
VVIPAAIGRKPVRPTAAQNGAPRARFLSQSRSIFARGLPRSRCLESRARHNATDFQRAETKSVLQWSCETAIPLGKFKRMHSLSKAGGIAIESDRKVALRRLALRAVA